MNVELILATRMLKRSFPIYTLVPVLFLIKSTESMITSLVSGLIVASGFYLGAFLMSFAANISLNFYYFSALFGYVARLIYIFGFLLLFRKKNGNVTDSANCFFEHVIFRNGYGYKEKRHRFRLGK